MAGPPFDTATALVAGTPANTVSWYTGEIGSDPPRATATARVDTSIAVSYGMRANEEGIRWIVQNVAALAAMTYPPGDPDAAAAAARFTRGSESISTCRRAFRRWRTSQPSSQERRVTLAERRRAPPAEPRARSPA